MTLSAADIDAAYQPTKTRATICLDSDLVLQIERLEEQFDAANGDDSAASQGPVIAAQIAELIAGAKAAEVEFVFKSIGRRAYSDLRRKHPPTDEQKAALREGQTAVFDPDGFLPDLFAAACESPTGTTPKWWREKYDDWGDGQLTILVAAVTAAQQGVNEVPKALRAYALIRGSGSKPE